MTDLLQAARKLGETGSPPIESERLAFEEWMAGHCWGLSANWDGKQYVSDAEQGGWPDPRAMMTRRLWAAWRDRAALAAHAAPGVALSPEKTAEIGFAVLRAHNDSRLWRALTYDSGPYDITTPTLALQDLGDAFYQAGIQAAIAQQPTVKERLTVQPIAAAPTAAQPVAPLRRGVNGVCTRSICECERQGLGDQCVWLSAAQANTQGEA